MATSTHEQRTFVRMLAEYRDVLTTQEIRTIRGQALAGDTEGAYKGLRKCKAAHDRKETRQ